MSLIAEWIGYGVMLFVAVWVIFWGITWARLFTLGWMMSRVWRQEALHHQGKCVAKCRYCQYDANRCHSY